MSTQKLVFEVQYTEKGFRLVNADMQSLGKETKKATKNTKELSDATNELTYKQNQGIIGNSSAARSFSKLNQAIGQGPNSLVGAYATLAANAFAVSAAFNQLRSAAAAENILRGLEAQGARTGRTLTILSGKLRDLTGAAISTADAMRITAQTTAAGIAPEDIERITTVATNAAKALGREIPDSVNRLVQAITKMEPELVDELGLTIKMTEASENYARQIGKTASSLTQAQKQQALMNAWLDQGTVKFGAFADKVSANPYDQLAATFTDLIKSGEMFINVVLEPLIKLVSGNKVALLGVLTVFAGTIKNQLLPSLHEAANIQSKIATANKELAIDKALEFDTLKGGKRKAINEYIAATQEGVATTAQFQKALEDVDARERAINNSARMLQETKLRRLSEEAERRKNIISIQQQQAKAQVANALAAGYEASSGASLINIKTKLIDTVKASGNSYKAASDAALLASTSTNKFANSFKATSAGVLAGAKVMGAAFINFLPVIGQIIFAIGIIKELWESLKSDATKKLEKAYEDLGIVIDSTKDKLKALHEIEFSSGTIFSKGTAALKNRLNTLAELSDGLQKYILALNEANKKEQSLNTSTIISSEELATIIDRGITPPFIQAAEDSWNYWTYKAQQSAGVAAKSIANKLYDIDAFSSDSDKAFAGALNQVENSLPGTVEQFYKLNKEFKDLNDAARDSTVAEFIKKIGEAAKKAQASLNELEGNISGLNKSYQDLVRSFVPTTPFDSVSEGLQNVKKSFIETRAQIKSGIFDEKDVDNFIKDLNSIQSGLGRGLLNEDTIKIFDRAQSLDNAITSLETERLKTNLEDINKRINLEERINNLTKERNTLLQKGSTMAEQDLQRMYIQVEEARKSSILTASELTLEQARLSVIQRRGVITAENVKKQQESQNKIIDLQVKQLKVQEVFLELEVKKAEFDRDKLQAIKDQIEKTKELGAEEISIELTRLKSQRTLWKSVFLSEEEKNNLDEQIKLLQDKGALYAKAESATLDLELANKRVQVAQEGQAAVQNQIQALDLSRLTVAEELAQQQMATLKIDEDSVKNKQALRNETLNVLKTQRTLQNVLTSGATVFTNELKDLEDAYKNRKDTLAEEFELQTRRINILKTEAAALGDISKVAMYSDELRLVTQINTEKARANELEYFSNVLEKVAFDTRTKGLELQIESLEVIKKKLDLQSDLLDKEQEIYKLQKEVEAARLGTTIGERAQKAIEYKALREQLDVAKQQLEFRKIGISLEYDLLEAKRLIMVQELDLQKKTLDAAIAAGKDTTGQLALMSKQLEATIGNLSKYSYNSLKSSALSLVDKELAILELKTKKAYYDIFNVGRSDNPASRMIQAVKDIVTVIQTTNNPLAKTEAVVVNPIVKSNDQLIESNTRLTEAINTLTDKEDPKKSISTSLTKIIETLGRPSGRVTSGFGSRFHPIHKKRKQHTGIDYGYGQGTPVTAQASGTVEFASTRGGYGNQVVIRSIDTLGRVIRTSYSHLSAFLVKQGQQITKGQVLGRAGMTGTATGPHLHFEVSINGQKVDPNKAFGIQLVTTQKVNSDTRDAGYDPNAEIVVTAIKTTKELNQEFSNRVAQAKAANDLIKLSYSDLSQHIHNLILGSKEDFAKLGPNGEATWEVLNGISTINLSFQELFKNLTFSYSDYRDQMQSMIEESTQRMIDSGMDAKEALQQSTQLILENSQTQAEFTANKIAGAFQTTAAIIGSIMSILNASSQQRIANIDKEIAAEQKRDGKSKESMAKLDSLEKKKDQIARKQFNTNKKLMMAQAVMATAAGITQALGSLPVPANVIMAGIIGAMGAAQIAVIAGTSYESAYNAKSLSTPSSLSIGKRGDTVNLANGPNVNAGGETGYLRGQAGTGTNASNYNTIGSAYGGDLMRGYGNAGFKVGEKGVETITPQTPIQVTPNDKINSNNPINATFNIHAIDSKGVEEVLVGQKGNIIKMIRDAANASGERFLEDVNVQFYTRPNVSKL